jgi:hypothetical protein
MATGRQGMSMPARAEPSGRACRVFRPLRYPTTRDEVALDGVVRLTSSALPIRWIPKPGAVVVAPYADQLLRWITQRRCAFEHFEQCAQTRRTQELRQSR